VTERSAAAGDEQPSGSLYEIVGGKAWFDALVERFYEGVADDPGLRPMYPEADLTGARERLSGFLVQYWGGPDDYSRKRGHPRLRMRHFPYRIDEEARDRWMHHMRSALRGGGLPPGVEAAVLDYFERSSLALVNVRETS
jgi:hemoglobin